MAISFDLFGTLVAVERPSDPASAVADALAERGVAVPDDFAAAYRERHVDAPPGAEVPLPAHVAAALRDRGVAPPDGNVVRRAVVAAFDPDVRTRPGAVAAVDAAPGPVACCSNCAVPQLATRALVRSDVDRGAFDAVVTSAGCGWRKPDRRVFDAVARRLGVPVDALVHVGDDPRTDGGIADAGGRFVDVADVPLTALSERLSDLSDASALAERGGRDGDAEAPGDRDGGDGR
ncbi:MAG: HAD family hydrolase [Haloferacaceae archaeon]